MDHRDGMNYAPIMKAQPVVGQGEFVFSVIALDHGHILGMTAGLLGAGATLKWVYDPDPKKIDLFCEKFPQAKRAENEEEILADPTVQLVASAAVPSERAPLGIRVMRAGKHYFTDKAPLISLAQLEQAKAACTETGKKYAVSYSERISSEAAVFAGELIHQGVIGRALQVLGMGPHRLSASLRPGWFFEKEKYGGILCDIGSHQVEQFLYYTGASDAVVLNSSVANYNHPQYPELEDFGDTSLMGNNGAAGYFRVDWFTPDGLSTWGDGRTFILGTEGYIELRKYVNVAAEKTENHVFWVDKNGEHYENVTGKTGFPFYGQLILDCMHGTENAMTQEHAFKAAEICLKAQLAARHLV